MDNIKNKVLEIKGVYKGYRSEGRLLEVLEDITFSMNRGDIIALVGPSGCGKTTLLNMIAGLLPVDGGELLINKNELISYIFQEPRLLPWMTVEENIKFIQDNYIQSGTLIKDEKTADIRERLLIKAGLLDFRDSYPAKLSGGMKQRVEIIRALAVKPDLILMDEPFKSLDISLKYQLQKVLMEEYSKEDFSMLYITHNPEDAVLLADKILILSKKPTKIYKEINIKVPREERSLQGKCIYSILQNILNVIS